MVTSIEISGLAKNFGEHQVLRGIDLSVRPGELLALLGPSGSGKTTLLRLIAGLEQPDLGAVKLDSENTIRCHPRERGVGFVFQHYALFRHMTVAANVGFGLKVRRMPAAQIAERVTELLKLVQLNAMADRYPVQLSGGQRQRVALARALAIRPRVLLLDEPFGALDAVVRRDLRRWLRRLHREMAITTIFVTHDQEEAFELADRVVLMNGGRISQIGTPEELYRSPADAFVFRFLGEANEIPCRIKAGKVVMTDGTAIALARPEHEGKSGIAHIRPGAIGLRPDPQGLWRVRDISGGGDWWRFSIERGDQILDASVRAEGDAAHAMMVGDAAHMRVNSGMIVFDGGQPPVALMPLDGIFRSHRDSIPYQAA